jgi:uncharacterized protein HemX
LVGGKAVLFPMSGDAGGVASTAGTDNHVQNRERGFAMPTDEKEEEGAADEEEEDVEEEPEEEAEAGVEEEEPEEARARGGAAWGFWRVVFALFIIAVVAVAGWLGWQYMAAQKERAREVQAREAETKKHLLLVTQKLRSATEGATKGDMDEMVDDLESASEAVSLALDIAIEDMRSPLEGLKSRVDAARDDVQARQERLRAEAEKEAKAAGETVSGALAHAESIVKQQYAPEEGTPAE